MLKVIRSMRELEFGQLMNVYAETNIEHAQQNWPDQPDGYRLALAEQDFYDYLRHCFFTVPGAVYCVWLVNGEYVSALRLEPWRDGALLEALETALPQRKQGYAQALVCSVQIYLREQGAVGLYSHISKRNTASIAVHEKCGFRKIHDYAAYLDGSVDRHSATYIYPNLSDNPNEFSK